MNKFFKFAAIALAILPMGLASCSDDDNNGSDNGSGAAKGTDAAVAAAGDSWKESRKYWEYSEAFLFGAASGYGIDPHIDTWPFDKTAFDNLMQKFHPSTSEDDATVIDYNISTGQNLTGFHAIEYLIFRNGESRKIADMTADEVYFCQSAAADLYLSACRLEAAWAGIDNVSSSRKSLLEDAELEPADNFGEQMKTCGQTGSQWRSQTEGAIQILEGCTDIIGEVRDSKIGFPVTGSDVNYIESPNAYNSITDFYDNIMSVKDALYGSVAATTVGSGSLMEYCKKAFQTDANAAVTALDNALDAIDSMKKPFVLYYTDASAKTAMNKLNDLEDAVNKLIDDLDAYKGNTTQESMLKTVNSNYVDNVVIPTYRTLADKCETLISDLDKLSY